MSEQPCPCGSGKPLAACCGLYLSGQAYPNTAEALMRSRFAAFASGNLAYLRKTWDPDTCPELDSDDLQTQWTRLEVIKSKQGLKRSIVEFKAWYLENDVEHEMHEISLFKPHKKRWVYVGPLTGWP
ncbi:SEC-C motif-containing protein [Microbulbifer donghaiensis]|uniref:SEC-C motif-containing protein n=1 Tax=Microbulbifer donghaiensis TaxID=494016 RepID=A0A1M4W1L7_9GAMM|nr:YchJ family metal-binding protein [Microbulbifer donghaiensis]SHE75151.1 SEC-C motif-containing protein [Microbulbifer donghaiensis]